MTEPQRLSASAIDAVYPLIRSLHSDETSGVDSVVFCGLGSCRSINARSTSIRRRHAMRYEDAGTPEMIMKSPRRARWAMRAGPTTLAIVLALSACTPDAQSEKTVVAAPPEASATLDEQDVGAEPDSASPFENPSKRRLPAGVVPLSNTAPHFGIALASLTAEQRAIVEDAWRDYVRIIDGGTPACEESGAFSDGGTRLYVCNGYNAARMHSIARKDGASGYDYGPIIDFLNGHSVERLRFVTHEESRRMSAATSQ